MTCSMSTASMGMLRKSSGMSTRTAWPGYRLRNLMSTLSMSSSSTVGVLTMRTLPPSMRVTESRFSTIRMSQSASSRTSPSSLICWALGRRS